MAPNKAMKRTSLPVIFSACTENCQVASAAYRGVMRQVSLTYQGWYIY